jgi:uncharacterized membrane protein
MRRTLLKTLTWRVWVIVVTTSLSYLFFGRLVYSLGFALVLNALNTIAYYLHERLWEG